MAMRNFWVEADIPGMNGWQGGARAREGTTIVTIRALEHGESVRAMVIRAFEDNNGLLYVIATDRQGNSIETVTDR